ncbi:MAG: hypothetical protein ACI957_002955 [Verrucomicrobiales bacterium]|jgi:hypothetical protein
MSPSDRPHQRKWERIISAFMTGDLDNLRILQRTGSRGRILEVLVQRCFDTLGISYEREPIFAHVPPSAWYADFAARHELKLVSDHRYNPDYVLADGTWVEVTLSENTAFKKLFRYGHQAPRLLVLWLDPDVGLHKQICEDVKFPNATINPISSYWQRLEATAHGAEVVRKLKALRELKHKIM